MLKIVQGSLRGRSLNKKISKNVRPTSSKIREAIFQILKKDIENSHWLDLCSGSGIMGIEALSAGAAKVTFIEQDRMTANTIRHHLKLLKLDSYSKVIANDINKFLKRYKGEAVDIIYFDPPYKGPLYQYIFSTLYNAKSYLGDPIILVEHPGKIVLEYNDSQFGIVDKRKYGDTAISIFRFEN